MIKRLTVISIFFVFLVSCSENAKSDKAKKGNETLSIQAPDKIDPKVDVFISLKNSVIKNDDQASINIRLTNNGGSNQKLLFDKPKVSTGGPWATSASVKNVTTNESVLEFENKEMLSSQAYFEEQLKDFYYILRPGQSISKNYFLTDLVVYKTNDDYLPSGVYEIQVFCFANASNKVRLTVR
jgi:hypothetical protein